MPLMRLSVPDNNLFSVCIVWSCELYDLFPIGSNLNAIQGNIKISTLKGKQDAVPCILEVLYLYSQFPGNGLYKFHLKTDKFGWMLRIVENVWCASLCIKSPG